jgi:hypothetical protein
MIQESDLDHDFSSIEEIQIYIQMEVLINETRNKFKVISDTLLMG